MKAANYVLFFLLTLLLQLCSSVANHKILHAEKKARQLHHQLLIRAQAFQGPNVTVGSRRTEKKEFGGEIKNSGSSGGGKGVGGGKGSGVGGGKGVGEGGRAQSIREPHERRGISTTTSPSSLTRLILSLLFLFFSLL
ncbi:hypothetical protein Cni_G27847 [Canna indica]|uniref:Uncharacterized protein n=1 Tax=Canna indica TaxID=4628 RepID=A0AAQ3QSM8_9LILI|nr:hypothetical protein Cni_G27847 [Canna indica]